MALLSQNDTRSYSPQRWANSLSNPDPSSIPLLPKAVLHEHLDGGLRVDTIVELADEVGYVNLPTTDPPDLARWFHQGRSGSLESYLAAFEHTVAVMQTPEAISRIAYESAEDLALDGVVYAEIRFAPSLNTATGLSRRDVLEAAWDGISRAMAVYPIHIGLVVTAMRQDTDSADVARDAIAMRHYGIVGFDLAGPERGYPPDRHVAACIAIRRAGLGLTIHAGEADGPHSMWRALALCGAQRLGHGVHIVDACDVNGQSLVRLDAFARRVRDHRIPLEIAITSNLHTGTYPSAAEHPFGTLLRAGFNVSINTDNRLMSGVSMSDEFSTAIDAFGLDRGDLEEITVRTIEAGFCDYGTRKMLIDDVVRPRYAELSSASGRSSP